MPPQRFKVKAHLVRLYATTALQSESAFGTVVHILGKGTASFLVAMGLSMALSRRQTPLLLIKRGLQLLLLAYLMNAAKFWLPIEVFNTMPEAFINAYGWQSPLSAGQLQFMVLTGDILQLAGVSLCPLENNMDCGFSHCNCSYEPVCEGATIYAFTLY